MEIKENKVVPISRDEDALNLSLDHVEIFIRAINNGDYSPETRFALLDFWLGMKCWLEFCLKSLKEKNNG